MEHSQTPQTAIKNPSDLTSPTICDKLFNANSLEFVAVQAVLAHRIGEVPEVVGFSEPTSPEPCRNWLGSFFLCIHPRLHILDSKPECLAVGF